MLSDPNLPDNLPTMNISDQVGPGWVSVAVGDTLRTADQYYAFHKTPPGWILGSFFTSQGEVNSGRNTHRRPVSLRVWIGVLPSVIAKQWRRFIS